MSMNTISLAETTSFIVDNRGKTVPTSEVGIPLIKTNCITNDRLYPIIDGAFYVSDETYSNWFRSHPEPDDIILTLKGSQNGAVCLVPDPVGFVIAQDMVALRVNKEIINPYYLFAALRSREVQHQIKTLDVSGVIPHLKKSDFDKLILSYPDREIQDYIGDLYFKLSSKISLLQEQNQTLEELAQTLFKRWFVDFEFPNENGTPYKSSGGKMIESELGEIPKGWQLSTIGENIETIGGGTPSTTEPTFWEDGEVLWYSPTDLTKEKSMYSNGSAKKITKLGLQKSSAKLFPAYSLLMTSRATVGELTINTHTACTNQGFITLIPNDSLSIYYLYNWLKSKLKTVHNLASGSTFPEISKTDFRNIEVLLASKCVHSEFDDIIKPIFKSIENNTKEIQSLTQLRDTLLPKLMSGELTINQEALKNV